MSSNSVKLAATVMVAMFAVTFFTQSLPEASATTTILSLNPLVGSVGTTVSVIGKIDTLGGSYRILWDNSTLLKEGLCSSGSNEVNDTITVPSSSLGIHTVVLYDNATFSRASREFRVKLVYEIQTRDLADLPVAGVTVEVYNATAGNLLVKDTTNETAWVSFLLDKGNYSFRAFWKNVQVGSILNQSVAGTLTKILQVQLVEITTAVKDEANAPLPLVSVTLAYNYTTRYGQLLAGNISLATNSAGIAVCDTFSNMSYAVEARRYGHLFYRTIWEELMILPSTQINITCPSYDLHVNVLDSKGESLGNVQVGVYELDPVRSVGAPLVTDGSGNANFRITLGRYRISVYNYSAQLGSTIVLNETTMDLTENQDLSVQCMLFNIELSVRVVDFFGQPIPNAIVEVERSGAKIGGNSTTDSNGLVLIHDAIGGEYSISAYIGGKLAEIQTFLVDKPKELLITAGGYTTIGGYALEIGQLTAVISIVLVFLFLTIMIAWRRILLFLRGTRNTSSSKAKEGAPRT